MRAPPGSDLASAVAAVARAVRESQARLDAMGRASLERWEQEGLPPAWYAWRDVRVTAAVAWRTAGGLQVAAARPGSRGAGRLSLTLRARPGGDP